MRKKILVLAIIIITFLIGFFVGGIIYRNVEPGTPLTIAHSKNLLKSSEISGLIASVILQKIPDIVPKVVFETDKTIVVEHPFPEKNIHLLFLPKKDIKNVGVFTEEDKEYIIDLHASIVKVIKMKNIKKYKLLSNGPGRQHLAYLHFHLMAD